MELSVRYSKLVDAKLRNDLVLKDGVIFNNRFEGDPKAGAVKVRKTGVAQVRDYNRANGIAPVEHDSEWITISVDKDKAVNEIVDGYEAAAIPDGIVADRLDEAGRGIAQVLDRDGAFELAFAGTPMTDTAALTAKTVYGVVVDARTALSKAGVPNDGMRYLVVTPDTYALLLKSDEFIAASDLGDAVKQTGAVGAIAGFNVYECANIGAMTQGEGEEAVSKNVEFIAGHPLYATRVNEWAVPVKVQDLSQSGNYIGACAVQGRKVYAHKVTNPAAILVKTKA